MRRVFIILGIIVAVLALILSATPLSQLAFVPAVIALLLGFVAFYLSKQQQRPRKTIQLIFLLTLMSFILSTYKTIFHTSEIGDLEEFETKTEASMEDSKDILEDLDMEELDVDYDDAAMDTLEVEELPE